MGYTYETGRLEHQSYYAMLSAIAGLGCRRLCRIALAARSKAALAKALDAALCELVARLNAQRSKGENR